MYCHPHRRDWRCAEAGLVVSISYIITASSAFLMLYLCCGGDQARTKEDLALLSLNLELQDRLDGILVPLLEQGKLPVGSEGYKLIPERIRPYVAAARDQYHDVLVRLPTCFGYGRIVLGLGI